MSERTDYCEELGEELRCNVQADRHTDTVTQTSDRDTVRLDWALPDSVHGKIQRNGLKPKMISIMRAMSNGDALDVLDAPEAAGHRQAQALPHAVHDGRVCEFAPLAGRPRDQHLVLHTLAGVVAMDTEEVSMRGAMHSPRLLLLLLLLLRVAPVRSPLDQQPALSAYPIAHAAFAVPLEGPLRECNRPRQEAARGRAAHERHK